MKCERCGHEVSPLETKCPVCGHELQGEKKQTDEMSMIAAILSILSGVTFFLFMVMLRVSFAEYNGSMVWLGVRLYLVWALSNVGFVLMMMGIIGVNVYFMLNRYQKPQRLMLGGVLLFGHLALTMFIGLLYRLFRTTSFALVYSVCRTYRYLLFLTIPLGAALIAYGYMMSQNDKTQQTSRTRYVFDISRHNPAVLDQQMRRMLWEMGYEEVKYKDEIAFRRGTGFLQAMQMIQIAYQGRMVVISGWICVGLGNLYVLESNLEGKTGLMPKRAVKRAIENLLTLL